MSHINQTQIKQEISQYLSSDEHLLSIGALKRVPSTGWLLLTRGMAWFFFRDVFVGVTDQRLIILPDPKKKYQTEMGENVIFANFSEVRFYTDALNNSILEVQKIFKGEPLKLRFKPGYQFQGEDQFDFITAVKQGMKAHSEA